jgi:hypothetical protein
MQVLVTHGIYPFLVLAHVTLHDTCYLIYQLIRKTSQSNMSLLSFVILRSGFTIADRVTNNFSTLLMSGHVIG